MILQILIRHHLSSSNQNSSLRIRLKTFWNSRLRATLIRLILSLERKLRKTSIVRVASLWSRKSPEIAQRLSGLRVKVLIMNLSLFKLHSWSPKGQLREPKLPSWWRVQALLIGEKIYLLQSWRKSNRIASSGSGFRLRTVTSQIQLKSTPLWKMCYRSVPSSTTK